MVLKHYKGTVASAKKQVRIATDAMDTAVGSVFEGKFMYRELDEFTSLRRISQKGAGL